MSYVRFSGKENPQRSSCQLNLGPCECQSEALTTEPLDPCLAAPRLHGGLCDLAVTYNSQMRFPCGRGCGPWVQTGCTSTLPEQIHSLSTTSASSHTLHNGCGLQGYTQPLALSQRNVQTLCTITTCVAPVVQVWLRVVRTNNCADAKVYAKKLLS